MDYQSTKQSEIQTSHTNLFKIKKASQWIEEAKNRPIPQMLFDVFWHEGELCILFADSNVGKSILAVQIANSISKGKSIAGFRLESHLPQQILYFDFELSDKQFETRYSQNFSNHYPFSDKLLRVEIDPEAGIPDVYKNNYEAYLLHQLEIAVVEVKAKILIIDNLTYLGSDNEKGRDALSLMKQLKALKKKYDLSVMVLAHTPKRDMSKPLNGNDVSGSKMLMNFCDSAFAIGRSTLNSTIRYIKQIKERSTEKVYGDDNVCVCNIVKHSNFLEFELTGYSEEREHLREWTGKALNELDQQIIEIKQTNPELSNRSIADKLKTNHMRVGRVLEREKDSITLSES
ncbi:AAA family ATPase [Spirosoma fluviale]|uniref:AAA domain-containing protein n=1 Tax=Spirosoma fluviale TaxID=1597977 RepID=A0A286FZB1_9BACT|nr:AAA family ATPase [Spirosoma fluviale]SOD88532.1 AAA domain-containing protein [Spirosoma fluviale]